MSLWQDLATERLQKKPSISHVGFLCFLGEPLLMLFWFSWCGEDGAVAWFSLQMVCDFRQHFMR